MDKTAIKLATCACIILATTGCASVVNETTQPVKIETKTLSGAIVTGAECNLQNDYGSITARSGDKAQVRRI